MARKSPFVRRRGWIATGSALHRLQIWWRGRKDGKRGIPRGGEKSLFEQRLMAQAKQHLAQVAEHYARALQELEGLRNEKIIELIRRTREYRRALHAYEKKKKDAGRDVTIHLSRGWYRVWIVLIALGEFALNSLTFAIVGEGVIATYLMALTLAVGLPVSAHFVGIWMKQWPKERSKVRRRIVALVGVSLLVVCTLGAITAVRQQYLSERSAVLEEEYQTAAGLPSGQDAAPQPAGAGSVGTNRTMGWELFFINLFVFSVAVMLSISTHDADPEFENLARKARQSEAKLDPLEKAINKLSADIDTVKQQQGAAEEEVRSIHSELIALYRDTNSRFRGSKDDKPTGFADSPKFDKISNLEEIQPAIPEDFVNKLRDLRHKPLTDEYGLEDLEKDLASLQSAMAKRARSAGGEAEGT